MDRKLFVPGCSYPDAFLEGRIKIEESVIGCIYQDPLRIDDTKKVLNPDSFLSRECKSFFNVCSKVRAKGFSTIDTNSIYSVLDSKTISIFERIEGFKKLKNFAKGVNLANWDIILDDLVRENTFCHLYDMNIDCSLPIKWNGEEIIPLDVFRDQRTEDLLAFWDAKLTEIPTATSSKVVEKGSIEFDDEWLASLQEGIENGDPFEKSFQREDGSFVECYPMLSKSISGLLPGTTTMLGAYSSVGKSTWWVGVIMALLASGKKVLVISNEEPMSKLKQKVFVWISKNIFDYDLTKKHLIAGQFTEEDRKVLNDVRRFWNQKELSQNLLYIFMNDPDIGLITKNIREYALKEGIDAVLYDTFKIQASDMNAKRQDLALVRDSRTLDVLAKKYRLIMMCSVQLAEHMRGKLWLDSSCLSNSKQIKEQLENLFLIRNAYEEEIDGSSKYHLRPFKRELVDGIWESTEIQLDPSKTYKVLFIEKSRSGANSSDSGTAILLEFDGDHATFKEVCRCRPKHGSIT